MPFEQFLEQLAMPTGLQFAQRARFDLTDALTSQVEHFANLFQG
jgi:hypothetical protein